MLVDGSATEIRTENMSGEINVEAVSNSQQNVESTVPPGMLSPGPGMGGPMGPPPPSSASDYGPDAPDTKEGIEELCPVCGDKVSGYHYGLLTCESCKGFFKRTVQNKKVYTCVADRGCHIDKSQRKRCPYCRFQKCLDVGMKLEAVRADRMRGGRNKFGPMYKRDRARRLQVMRQKAQVMTQCPMDMVCPPSTPPSFSSAMALAYSPDGGGGPPVKSELIQIPHLSSSTSSPDSSPSPLATTAAGQPVSIVPHYTAPPVQLRSLPSVGPQGDPKIPPWVTPNQANGGLPPPGTNSCSPNSPKPFHYEGGGALLAVPLLQGPTTNGTNGGPNVGVVVSGGPQDKVPHLIRELQKTMLDDKEWQSQLFSLLQNQTYNQCEVDLFELMCKVIDQSLFAQVDWARNSVFFKELAVDDQMKLLQQSWSEMLILDHLHQRIHNGLPDETPLPNGQKFDLLCLALLGVPSLNDQLQRVGTRLQELKFDSADYLCLKFLLLLNPEVRGLSNSKLVHEAHEKTQQALLEYSMNCYPHVPDKFNQMLQQIEELRVVSVSGEDYLYFKHINGSAPTQTLLMEMLHAKKK